MLTRKLINIGILLLLIFTGVIQGNTDVEAMPMSPTDPSTVPHYFGPYPNWANSPFTLPDAEIVVTGDGSGATAVATVGAGGTIIDITITDPGHDYTKAKIDILGSGTGATADVTIVKKGAVVAVTVDTPGTGYTSPTVTFSDNGGATASAYGGVDQVIIVNAGQGYTYPTVDFDMPDELNGVQAKGHAEMDASGRITAVIVDFPGSGYSTAPGVTIRNGSIFEPWPLDEGGYAATATSSLSISSIVLNTFGADYKTPPTVTITDPTGTGATATAALDNGVIAEITLKKGGSGYLTAGGIRKFVDGLPRLTEAGANNLGQYLPIAVPQTLVINGVETDYYEIAVVQHREKMHSDLPPTLLREYVQISTDAVPGKRVALQTALLDGTTTPTLMPSGGQAYGVDNPHYLGPVIIANKDRAVRITFYNLLPTGSNGDLFLPTDSTIMGAGMGPMEMMMEPEDDGTVMDMVRNQECSEAPKSSSCFKDNRATLHLHGGNTPWISDGTPHQWITPAGEDTPWPEGVSVVNVPDMVGLSGIPECSSPSDGCQTFYYTNQQSARLMFYHDHSWGITRLNVYAGEAAGYIITDPTEQALIDNGLIPADQIPLIIQDRTFVPQAAQLAWQDPTWDTARWGGFGNLWYHHVYMPAQNPGSPSGMSSFGRWMYSPWFWPPQNAKHGPIANPYFDAGCDLDDPNTWQYQEEPFCEPPLIPGTPLISAGMEQFNDTPIVNGTAYPTVTLQPKAYRLRLLNAANDRFWNLQWYVADSTGTEVALKADELAAAALDPVVFPTPDLNLSPAGPDWIQIGNEGGFLPAPVVVDGQQVTTWITDPTRFDAGLVDQHSLLISPAERADVIVDFSQFAGKTLILYNDAPAAFPARIPSYDYYTGAPDLMPVGAPSILPGYGPNTRTIMQVKIEATAAAPAFNLGALEAAFRHKADGSGVFEAGQHPIIVGQAVYNSAYGTNFASGGWCNSPSNPSPKCDGFARINEQGGDMFKFDTLLGPQISVRIEPKAIQDETSESNFDEFGRMTAALGVEVVPATPGTANTVLFPYMSSITEVIDTSKLPRADIKVTPISSGDDGTQIWKITHNGVDTHPIHVHAYDVQILNRVTWDNIIKPPHPTELGWKETFRVSPLEDTYVALRPVIPTLPFDFPNSIRLLSPMMQDGAWIANTTLAEQLGLPILGFAPNGDPIDIRNHYVNFGAEYVYHCHILSHEEMDMMRPVILAIPPVAPSDLVFDVATQTLSWTDRSLSETAFVIEKSADGGSWVAIGLIERSLLAVNTIGETVSFVDGTYVIGDQYRVFAQNTVGDTWDYSDPNLNEILPGTFAFPVVTVKSAYALMAPVIDPPAAPSVLSAANVGETSLTLNWQDNSANENGFTVQSSTDAFITVLDTFTVGPNVTSLDVTALAPETTYSFRVEAFNAAGQSGWSETLSVSTLALTPAAPPSDLAATAITATSLTLTWVDNSENEEGFTIESSIDGFVTVLSTFTVDPNVTNLDVTGLTPETTYSFRVEAFNLAGPSGWSVVLQVTTLAAPQSVPAAPSALAVSEIAQTSLTLAWQDNSDNEDGFTIEVSTDKNFNQSLQTFNVGPDVTSVILIPLTSNTKYYMRVAAFNIVGASPWSDAFDEKTLR